MRQTHNWKALKTDFVTGDITSVSEFAKMRGIPRDTIKKHSKGWSEAQAQHRHNIGTEIEEDDTVEKVISARKRREHMSTVIDGALSQWRRLNGQLAEIEEAMKGTTPSMKMLQELRKSHTATTKLIPELIRVMELLDGGVTSRTDTVIDGKHTKDMSEEELYEAERAEAKRILEKYKEEKE